MFIVGDTLGRHAVAAGVMRRIRARPEGPILLFTAIVQAACILTALIWPAEFRNLSAANLSVLIKPIVPLGIMAVGVSVLMIAGEFDLSVGAIYTFCAVLAALLVGGSTYVGAVPAIIALPVAIAAGAAASMLNGLVSIVFAIPSFIVSLGALLFWKGATLFVHGATSLQFRAEPQFLSVFSAQVGVVNAGFIWFVGLIVGFHILLCHRRVGNHISAVGGNRRAAVSIGVKPFRTKLTAFAIAGVCAAFAGVLAMTRVGSVQPGGGIGLELEAIAACVIGGVALTGGRGSVLGAAGREFRVADCVFLAHCNYAIILVPVRR